MGWFGGGDKDGKGGGGKSEKDKAKDSFEEKSDHEKMKDLADKGEKLSKELGDKTGNKDAKSAEKNFKEAKEKLGKKEH